MAIFKCKMCGGTIEFNQGDTIGTCDSCGIKQTLPRLDDDRVANLYDRANHFRRNNDYDKAAGIYERILNENTTDAEAYWSLVLCHYGVEYVEDPTTRRRVPTVNRAQFTSIFDDGNYKSALRYADTLQKSIYEKEASEINEIQKGILAISQNEEPFDVFICYKETDANGRRTRDSVIANDLYHLLVQEGFKVFFSRITLEDKLGTAYEPYIFAALNSAKVMVVLGTKAEHFNAVWVKNEWSRYLALVKDSGGKKVLIPAYRDMDPYDLPEEFSHLQAQDMSKLGFMQDLIRGIKKLTTDDEPKTVVKETITISPTAASAAPLLKRAFMFLEDEEWAKADDFCEQVLNIDPENAEAYLGKLMAELKVKNRASLKNYPQPFDGYNNYRKVLRFGNEKLVSEVKGYIAEIRERNEKERLEGIYSDAVAEMKVGDEESYKAAAAKFSSIHGYKNADDLAKECLDIAESCRKDSIYASGRSQMTGNAVSNYEAAINTFRTISGWKDADEHVLVCKKKIEEIKAKEEAARIEAIRKAVAVKKRRKRTKNIAKIVLTAIAAFIVIIILIINAKYNNAVLLYNNGKYDEAITAFKALSGYKDSSDKTEECLFLKQKAALSNVSVGSTIKFGFYEQDNNTSNGKEEIEWIVLAMDGNKALIISKYALDCQRYNSTYMRTTWENCSLRTWLNWTFYNTAFGVYHKNMIQNTTVTADKNPTYNTSPGNNTNDKVFLLSITEVNNYFSSDSSRQCQGTDYCYALDATKTINGNCWWWLRSPSYNSLNATVVDGSGSVCDDFNNYVLNDNNSVRPAMWINLGS